ncbi:MAG: 3'-5' exonuclease, partial [Bryobacteraceae bacterium]
DLMEEERRLCYVGMTRARRRLFLTMARSHRRFGAGDSERTRPSRFLSEVPPALVVNLGGHREPASRPVEEVRRTARRNTYTGKTYNSLDNITQFFTERGLPPVKQSAPLPVRPQPSRAAGKKTGSTVNHPKYGRGTILRREGDGEEAKLTINFHSYGLKKLVAKYAGLTND